TKDKRIKTKDKRIKTKDKRIKTKDKRIKTKDKRIKTKDKRIKTKGSKHYEGNHKNHLYKKNYENGLQLPDFYLFTFIFYLLHE
ncbi:MAG: hypothetical protein WC780_11040, partial [Lentimicrobiaceae bacterium]